MSPSPAHFRATAGVVRTTAGAIRLDLVDLPPHTGPETWQGPAAARHRGRVAIATATADEIVAALQRVADALDDEAVVVDRRLRDEADAHRRRWERTAERAANERRAGHV